MKRQVNWLQAILETLQALTAFLSFLIAAAEILHEGVAKAGEEKKNWVLSQWEQVRKQIGDALSQFYEGDTVLKVWNLISDPKVVSILIDTLVLVFNLKGLFPKGK